MVLSKTIQKKYQVIIKHDVNEFECCIDLPHIHHAEITLQTSDLEKAAELKNINNSLETIDYMVEADTLKIEQILEKFYDFCNTYICVDKCYIKIGNDYDLMVEITRES